MDLRILNIEKDHKEGIYSLMEEVNRVDSLSYSLTEEWLDYVIHKASEGIFLALDGDEVLGLGTLMINPLYRDQATLNILVHPDHRKKGIGSCLYDRVYLFARENGVEILELMVKERLEDSFSFARKRGFTTFIYSWQMEVNLHEVDLKVEGSQDFTLREANEEDGPLYQKLIRDGFGDDLGESALFELLEDSSNLLYILEGEEGPIGSATAQIRRSLSLAYLYDILILKNYRGQGWGSHLLKACLRSLKDKGLDKVALSVSGENKKALRLYEKLGFREVDVEFIMTKDIEKL